MWFIQSNKFNEWKKNGSLLWIRGNRVSLPSSPPFITVENDFLAFSGLWKEYSLVCSFPMIPVIGN
jgi:hypothetical protein